MPVRVTVTQAAAAGVCVIGLFCLHGDLAAGRWLEILGRTVTPTGMPTGSSIGASLHSRTSPAASHAWVHPCYDQKRIELSEGSVI